MKKRIITICGELGAGKSMTTKLLLEALPYEHIYTGALHRKRAEELGLTFDEYHKQAEQDHTHDHEVDRVLKEFLEKGDSILCDSNMAAWFAPEAFKVFLDVDPEVAAERIFHDQKTNPHRKSEAYESLADQRKKNEARRASNILRYQELYGITNYLDKEHYSIVIDTTHISPETVRDTILTAYHAWLAGGTQ